MKKLMAMLLLAGGSAFAGPRVFFGLNIGVPAPVPYYYSPPAYYAPPAPVVAYAPPAPAPGYSWIAGYWYPVGPRWVWHGGYWARPPYAGAIWVGPRYYGGRYYRGYWRR